jgi:hypothetical protein
MRLADADRADCRSAGSLEVHADHWEGPIIPGHVVDNLPDALAAFQQCRAYRVLWTMSRAVIAQMERRVVAMSDAQQQDPAVALVDLCERRALTVPTIAHSHSAEAAHALNSSPPPNWKRPRRHSRLHCSRLRCIAKEFFFNGRADPALAHRLLDGVELHSQRLGDICRRGAASKTPLDPLTISSTRTTGPCVTRGA